jgi:hypothetical protein
MDLAIGGRPAMKHVERDDPHLPGIPR